MTERLRLGLNSGLATFRMSLPTFDVDDATFDQLLFDINYGVYSGVFASGNVPFNPNDGSWSVTGSNDAYGTTITYSKVISFGKTFNSVPKIALAINDPYLGVNYLGPKYSAGNTSFDNIGGTGLHGNQTSVGASATTTAMTISFSRVYYDGTPASFPGSAGYVIFHG